MAEQTELEPGRFLVIVLGMGPRIGHLDVEWSKQWHFVHQFSSDRLWLRNTWENKLGSTFAHD